MSIFYKTIGRNEPGVVGGGQTKFYPLIVRPEAINYRQLVKEIAELSTLNTSDVYAVIDSLHQIMIRHLSHGRTVEMGHFGKFKLSLKTKGAENADEVSFNSIIGNKILFRPSTELNQLLGMVKYRKWDNPFVNGSTKT